MIGAGFQPFAHVQFLVEKLFQDNERVRGKRREKKMERKRRNIPRN